MSASPQPKLSYAEYLGHERSSEIKHEWLRGELWAMAGGTPKHAVLAANIASALKNLLNGKPCAVFSSDLRVRVEETDRSTYPDVTVVCGKRQTARDDPNAVVNPLLIVEVLSDGTEASDRGEKFAHLQRLPSLQEYVLVDHRTRRVEVFRRGEGVTWTLLPHVERQTVELKSIDGHIELDEIYLDPTE